MDNKLDDELIFAVQTGNADRVKRLLAAGAYPNAIVGEGDDNEGETALMLAVERQNAEAAKALLDGGANPDHVSPIGRTALMQVGNRLDYALFVDGNRDPHYVRHEMHRDAQITKILLAAKADPNFADRAAGTALSWAVHHSNVEIVRLLLSARANPNMADNHGMTALHWAARRWRWERGSEELNALFSQAIKDIVRLLLLYRANPNVADNDGMTALSLAVGDNDDAALPPANQEARSEIVSMLEKAGAK